MRACERHYTCPMCREATFVKVDTKLVFLMHSVLTVALMLFIEITGVIYSFAYYRKATSDRAYMCALSGMFSLFIIINTQWVQIVISRNTKLYKVSMIVIYSIIKVICIEIVRHLLHA